MRGLRRFKGRSVLVSAHTGEYAGELLTASRDGVELVSARAVVSGHDVPLVGTVWVPAHQIVHVQVADS